jgi:ribosomal protein L13E
MTQLLVDAIPDKSSSVEDTENNEESVLELFVFLLSYHAKNGMIVEHALSLLQRWFQYHKDTAKMMSSTSSKEVLSVIKKIIKSEECRSSKKVLTLLQTLVKSIKEMHKDDVFQATDPQLKVFFSASEMKEAGMTSKEMKEMGYTVKELRDARFTITQLQKELGYSLAELLDGGYLLSDLKEHYSLEDILSSGVIGYFGVDLKKEGYSIEEVKKAGKTAAEMKNYYSLVEIRDEYGLSVKELLDLGYQASDFFSADPQYRIQCKGFESSVIVNFPFILDLLALFPSNVSSASLLYRGSRDGFDKATYHSKCDNQGPQIEIVKCSEGYIFGCYMAADMPTNGPYIAGSSNASFLFSLKNPGGETAKKYPIKPERNANAFYSQSTPRAFSFGQSTPPAFHFGQSTPHFGVVPEMKTNDLKTVEFGNIASSYEDYGEGNLRFTGKPLSNIAEVEVWKIVNS